MPSTVKVPLFGQQSKGTVAGVTIGGLAVAGVLIWRSQKKAKAAAAASTTAAQAASGYGYGTITGYGYGTYPQGFYGYGEPGNMYGYGASGGFSPTGYYGYGLPVGGSVPNVTNAQWAQAAISQLSSEGYDPQTVSAALGAYELGQPVTPAQQTIIQAAIGIEGYPPQSGANGDPPGIKVQGTPGGGGGGGQSGTKVTVPNVKGIQGDQARTILQAAGLKEARIPVNTPKGKPVVVTSQSPSAGRKVKSGSTVTVHVKVGSP